MTPEQAESRLMYDPIHCPFCHNDSEWGDDWNYIPGKRFARVSFCPKCNAKWIEVYHRTAVHVEGTPEYNAVNRLIESPDYYEGPVT